VCNEVLALLVKHSMVLVVAVKVLGEEIAAGSVNATFMVCC